MLSNGIEINYTIRLFTVAVSTTFRRTEQQLIKNRTRLLTRFIPMQTDSSYNIHIIIEQIRVSSIQIIPYILFILPPGLGRVSRNGCIIITQTWCTIFFYFFFIISLESR